MILVQLCNNLTEDITNVHIKILNYDAKEIFSIIKSSRDDVAAEIDICISNLTTVYNVKDTAASSVDNLKKSRNYLI